MMDNGRVLDLSNADLLGSGEDRLVYRHPLMARRCVKVLRNPELGHKCAPGPRNRLFWLTRMGDSRWFDYNYVDVNYLERWRGNGEIFRHLPVCYGFVETSLGTGVCWEYLVNHDGSRCMSLKEWLAEGMAKDKSQRERVWRALDDFFAWQLRNGVMLREMGATNTLLRWMDERNIRIYHIDTVGCVDLFPLALYSKKIARLRIRSKIIQVRKIYIMQFGPPPQGICQWWQGDEYGICQ